MGRGADGDDGAGLFRTQARADRRPGVHLDYWGTTGAAKTFTHPLDRSWLDGADRAGRVVDYGCGYGRLTAELAGGGFGDLIGVDVSHALIGRARREQPGLRFEVLADPPRLDEPDASVAVAVLFAVLTCVPADSDQVALLGELRRVLRPGGLLYLSDLLLAGDERNRRRYDRQPFGTFMTDDGALCRHHDPSHLRRLVSEGFEVVREKELTVATMNGNRSPAMQILAVRL